MSPPLFCGIDEDCALPVCCVPPYEAEFAECDAEPLEFAECDAEPPQPAITTASATAPIAISGNSLRRIHRVCWSESMSRPWLWPFEGEDACAAESFPAGGGATPRRRRGCSSTPRPVAPRSPHGK